VTFPAKSLDWVYWERSSGISAANWSQRWTAFRFNHYTICIQADIDDQGLALGWSRLVSPFYLVRVFERSYATVPPHWRRLSPAS
jgi:hypothetical protein